MDDLLSSRPFWGLFGFVVGILFEVMFAFGRRFIGWIAGRHRP